MGNWWARYYSAPDVTPDGDAAPTFDPLYGFPNGRKPRVMIATEQEMMAAQIPVELRDYCAHLLIDFEKCESNHYPNYFKCSHAKHQWELCEYEDYIMRMKEYERERRLLQRQKRKKLREQQLETA